jgi:2-amino-4-hydroxy-6-hydroxymethyldihydropteridine diphosphokinase
MASGASSRAQRGPAPGTPVLLGLGSNRWHGRHGRPEAVLAAAVEALAAGGVEVLRQAPVIATRPLGPSDRCFANGAVLGRWAGTPAALLALAKAIERDFGRRRGRRWGARVLDIDLLAFGSAAIRKGALEVPHPHLHLRPFVLGPLLAIWPEWRHPRLGLTVRHLAARLAKPRPVALAHRQA